MRFDTLETLNPFGIMPGEHAFVVHAHPDDESVSTGGAIMHLSDLGAVIHGITGSDGEHSTKAPLFSFQRKRIGELHNSYAFLGNVPPERIHRLQLTDGEIGLNIMQAAIAIAELIAIFRPSIFVSPGPCGFDNNPDHIAMHEATLIANRLTAQTIGNRAVIWALNSNGPSDAEIRFDPDLKLEAVLLNESQFPSERTNDGELVMSSRTLDELSSYSDLMNIKESYTRMTYPYL